MEINTEINKVFGTEMAKIFAESISEEEIKETASKVYKRLIEIPTDSWGRVKDESEIGKLIKSEILEKTRECVIEELKKPESKDVLKERAVRIVEKAKKLAEDEITEKIAANIVNRVIEYNFENYNLNQTLKNIVDRLNSLEERR